MAERDQVDDGDAFEGGDEEVAPSREFPISSTARFTIGGKPLPLDEFIEATTGELADRPPVKPVEQPQPAPKAVIWNSRRPLND